MSSPHPYEYDFDFSRGLGDWASWMRPSVVAPIPGTSDASYVRLQAPGALDPNHIDGIGSLSLIAHLSTRSSSYPGYLDLRDAEIDLVIRGHDFDPHGAKIVFWVCSTLPDGLTTYEYPVGAQITNWANTGNDLAGMISDEWQTITVKLNEDAADWTEAGNYRSNQGDWGARYQPLDLSATLSKVDATLHLVAISDSPDDRPTGFLDLQSITIRTALPAASNGRPAPDTVAWTDEDSVATGSLASGSPTSEALASEALATGHQPDVRITYAIIDGSATHGIVTLDAKSGKYEFVPDPDFFGPDALMGSAGFRYVRIVDGVASSPMTALINVIPRNDAPEATVDTHDITIANDAPFAFTLLRGHDVDGDRLTFHIVDGSASNGQVALDAATGRYVFTPDAGHIGQAGFSYVVSDGQANSEPMAVSFALVDDAPPLPSFDDIVAAYLPGAINAFVHHAILLAMAGDTNAAYHYGGWLASGTYVNQDTASAAAFLRQGLAASPDAALQLAQLYIAGDGVGRDYAEARSLLTSIDTYAGGIFRMAMLDDLGLGAPQDHAHAVAGFITAAEMGHAEAMATVGRRYLSGEGVALSADDAYFWIKAALDSSANGFNGGFLEVLRANLAKAAALLSAERVAVLDTAAATWQPGEATPVNDTPVAAAEIEAANGVMGTVIAGALLAGTDADGQRLSYILLDTASVHGAIMLDAHTGAFTYTPANGFFGNAEFTYALSDGTTVSAAKQVTLTVAPVTIAIDDFAFLPEDGRIVRDALDGVVGNDVSRDASALTVTAVNGSAAAVGSVIASDHGTLRLNADGSFTFDADRAGALTIGEHAVDTVSYTIRNAGGEMSTATLSIRIDGVDGTVLTGNGVLFGTPWGDRIIGGSGSDYLIGAGGNDRLDGGAGDPDTLQGGTGDDIYIVRNAGDSVFEFADEGIDTVQTMLADFVLGRHVENLAGLAMTGQTLTGNELDNVIRGGSGNDRLDGDAGDDLLSGGAGDDVLDGGAGIDTVDYADADAGVTVNILKGQATDGRGGTDTLVRIENAIGSTYSDTMIGDAGANRFDGGDGHDYLIGGDGDDVLAGGTGAPNELQGGRGDDRYIVSVAQDTLVEFAGEGIDTVETALARYALRDHFESLAGTATTGQVLTGNAADNVIRGGSGDDRLIGGAGNNILDGGDGRDTVDYSSAAKGILVNLATGVATNGAGGVDLLFSIENVRGTAWADVIIGNAGVNHLEGGEGRDYLIGGDDNDILEGGTGVANELQGRLGNDVYIVTALGDTVIEFADEGVDTVRTTMARHVLRDHVENLVGLSDLGQILTGNDGTNIIQGGGGTDIIDGAGGADMLIGGIGSDSFVFMDLPRPDEVDTIVDFVPGEDRLLLSAAQFGGLSGHSLPGEAFAIGTEAHDMAVRILYDPISGDLAYDPDGVGSGSATVFAHLSPGLQPDAWDILFI